MRPDTRSGTNRSVKQETHYERPARHGPNGLNGKRLRVTHYGPRRALPCRPLVMGYSQLISIKIIRAVPCRDVPRRAGRSLWVSCLTVRLLREFGCLRGRCGGGGYLEAGL